MLFLFFLTGNILFGFDGFENKSTIRYIHPSYFDIKEEPVEKFATWKSKPDVKICNYAPVTVDQVKRALSWWEKLGYKFGYVYRSNCVENAHYGNIVISLAGQDFDFNRSYGTTNLHYDTSTGVVHWAQIFLPENVRERVLEHEIGHALGWHHSARTGHILHPSWQRGGWDSTGLRVPTLNLTRSKSALKSP